MLILVTGGAGSGKSQFAERLSMALKQEPFRYIATMQIWDAECRARVAKHRQQRAGKGFGRWRFRPTWQNRRKRFLPAVRHCWNVSAICLPTNSLARVQMTRRRLFWTALLHCIKRCSTW